MNPTHSGHHDHEGGHKQDQMQDMPAPPVTEGHGGHGNGPVAAGPAQGDEHAGHRGHGSGVAASPADSGEHAGHSGHGTGKIAGPVGSGQHAGHKGHGADHSGHEQMFRTRFWQCLALSIPVLLYSPAIQGWLGFRAPAFRGSEWLPFIFSLLIFAHGGVPFLRMAVPEIRMRRPGMMTLISLAITVAFGYSLLARAAALGEGFFWELVTLIDVMLLGHWVEMRSVRQASGALDELARLMPDTAERLLADGTSEVVAASLLQNHDLVLVRPGATVPADGEVVEGDSSVNQAMITGESRPVDKGPGDTVIGGTINGDGSLRVKVTATGDQTALAGIMRLVAQAQASKSETQVLADRAAGWLFYVALAAAAVTSVAWTIAVGLSPEVLKRAVTVLVIACPHALGLAVPLVVAITTSLAARHGILVRDRRALEALREVDVVIFDKTGTLTQGEFGVVAVAAAGGWDEDGALALAAAVEGDSEHSIARAIRDEAKQRGLSLPPVEEFAAMKGRGVQAKYADGLAYVGGPRLLETLSLALPPRLADFEKQAAVKAESVVYLVAGAQIALALAVADVIRPESYGAIRRLHDLKVEVAMLTGDAKAVAEAVASELGIDHVYAEVLPEQKHQRVADLQAQGKHVAMVGDGVNDAPALMRADVGIAIGSGTDVAVESAGLILVQSNPLDVVRAIALSRASYHKMVQNLWWAAGYNIIALPLAAGVLAPWGILLSPAVGALLMSLSTVIVAINAQLLRREDLKLSTLD
jgi:Cu2+-exporting ATPase